jgi:hypothetical protein
MTNALDRGTPALQPVSTGGRLGGFRLSGASWQLSMKRNIV